MKMSVSIDYLSRMKETIENNKHQRAIGAAEVKGCVLGERITWGLSSIFEYIQVLDSKREEFRIPPFVDEGVPALIDNLVRRINDHCEFVTIPGIPFFEKLSVTGFEFEYRNVLANGVTRYHNLIVVGFNEQFTDDYFKDRRQNDEIYRSFISGIKHSLRALSKDNMTITRYLRGGNIDQQYTGLLYRPIWEETNTTNWLVVDIEEFTE